MCSRQPARALPLHAGLEPARLLSVAARCRASAMSHARLCGRLASCCDAAVKRDTRATAARHSSVHTITAAVCSRQPARALPLHAGLEPAGLLSAAARCQASARSHATVCGRLASCCDAAVKRDTRATAARHRSVHTITAAVCSRQPARALPLHAHREPARLLSIADRCQASLNSHARLCDRLASCCDAEVARDCLLYTSPSPRD